MRYFVVDEQKINESNFLADGVDIEIITDSYFEALKYIRDNIKQGQEWSLYELLIRKDNNKQGNLEYLDTYTNEEGEVWGMCSPIKDLIAYGIVIEKKED